MNTIARTLTRVCLALALALPPLVTQAAPVSVRFQASMGGATPEVFSGTLSYDDSASVSFTNGSTLSSYDFDSPDARLAVTSDLGLDLNLKLVRITVKNDAIPASDTETLGHRDSVNVFAYDGANQSVSLLLMDFLGGIGDPNDALDSLSLVDALSHIALDPFVRGAPYSRGVLGLNGDISRQAEIDSITAVPLPGALVLMLGALGSLVATRPRSRPSRTR